MNTADFSCPFHSTRVTMPGKVAKLRKYFPIYASHGSVLLLERANTGPMHSLYPALGFVTNVATISASYWLVSLNVGYAQNFCASLSGDSSQSLASKCSRRTGITSCLNPSAKQQSNIVLLFQPTFLRQIWRGGNVDAGHCNAWHMCWISLQKQCIPLWAALLRKLHLSNNLPGELLS